MYWLTLSVSQLICTEGGFKDVAPSNNELLDVKSISVVITSEKYIEEQTGKGTQDGLEYSVKDSSTFACRS